MGTDRDLTYECSEGHQIKTPRAIAVCLALVRGKPCPGTLKQVGKGSRGGQR